MSVLTPDIAGTRGDDFAWFAEEYCVQSVDVFAGVPLTLEDWQREIFAEALTETTDGALYWQSVAVILPRKNGKTTMLGALALYALLEREGQPEVLLAAASDKQAGRLFDAATSFVRRNARLSRQLAVREFVGELSRVDGGGKVYRMSSSPERLHGYNPSLVVADEVAQWTKPSLRKAWAALTTGGGARRQTQVFTISTAGEAHERQEGILGRMIDANEKRGDVETRPGLTISRNHDARTLVYNFSAPTEDRNDVDALKLANPASWITTDFLRRQASNPELSDAEVLQYHGCVWAAAESQWIARAAWDALERPNDRLQAGDRITLGFDGSQYHDATALVACRVEDGLLAVIGLWAPDGHVDWEVPRHQVHVTLARAMETYDVVAMAADPPDWRAEIETWQAQYGTQRVYGFATNKGTLMAPAVDRLHTAIVTGEGVLHTGDRRLTEHVLNARVHDGPAGVTLKKERKDSPNKIDAAVAAVIAYEARAVANAPSRRRQPGRLLTF